MSSENNSFDKLCTTVELAKFFGVSSRTVQRLAQEGILPEPEGTRKGTKLYSLMKSVQAYCSYLSGKEKAKADDSQAARLKEQKLQTEIKLKESQAELHELKTDIAKGKYIALEDARLDVQRFFIVFKKFAMAIPSRMGGIIAGYVEPVVARGIEKDLQKEINDMLRTFIFAGQPADNHK